MKKIWIILFAAALVLSGCKHPYMEGMVGEFPFIDCPTKTVFEFEADKQFKQNRAVKQTNRRPRAWTSTPT